MTSSRINDRRPLGIDLFAGAGGLSLGFEQAGVDIAAAVEIDPIHCATHQFNFPYSKTICADILNLTGDEIRRKANIGKRDIDVVFGGAPCQGFSMIGKRALDDPRNHLVFHFVRIVAELKPKYFVFENVKGLTVGKHVSFLKELMTALEKAGYAVVKPYHVLNAADFLVPQDRRRLFLIGGRRGLALPAYPKALKTRVSVWEAIGDLPDADTFEQLMVSDAIRVPWKTLTRYARRLRCLDLDPSDFGYSRNFDANILTSSLRTQHTDISKQRFLQTEHGQTEPVSRFRKLPPNGLCNTLRAGTDSARGAFTSPRPIHPFLPRVITVREAARLHSYPDWFRFHTTKWHGFRQVGNSVPPHLARAIASEIVRALGLNPFRPDAVIDLIDPELLSLDMAAAARHFRVPRDTIAQRRRNTQSIPLELR